MTVDKASADGTLQGNAKHRDSAALVPSEPIRESLSALLDGEASEMELHRILKSVETDDGVRHTWQRYQMVSAVVRGQQEAARPAVDLSGAIMAAIDNEPAHSQNGRKTVWESLSKVGVAASVAAAVVFSAQFIGVQTADNTASSAATALAAGSVSETVEQPSGMVNTAPAAHLPAGLHAPALNARVVSVGSAPAQPVQQRYTPVMVEATPARGNVNGVPSPEVQAYLQRVMEIHTGHAALNSSRGMLPYARVPLNSSDNR